MALRRQRDQAAYHALEALDEDLPIETILERFTAAGLPHPLSVHCHPRDELLNQIANVGVSALRSIEVRQRELEAGEADTGTGLALSKDANFRLFMSLKLQVADGSRVRFAFFFAGGEGGGGRGRGGA
jgi:hypothetical protein